MPNQQTDLLIIGAGPFGLAIAAQAAHLGIEYLVVGKPMDFWRKNMPSGMYLRSSWDCRLISTCRTRTGFKHRKGSSVFLRRDRPRDRL